MVRFLSWLCHRGKRKRSEGHGDEEVGSSSGGLSIRLSTLYAATHGFSDNNRLGQGGFGPVYKGLMPNGQQIAVKKLSLNSKQGLKEFINEVRVLLKVQHRNLVSLLGYCTEHGEKMLVYQYLPNRSLDHHLFDKRRSMLLDWPKRLKIIEGIAKGLLYLHQESPVRIIHRDIKASNILLDENLNPYIADFGLARLFEGDDTHANTFRVAGTYGYMAPEYTKNGYLSVRTDVFSFGVLVLEIMSGRKNLDPRLDGKMIDLLSYAWKLWEEQKVLDLVDGNLAEYDAAEATMCIQIGLLCCQATISHRPDMSMVHLMLASDSFTLPKPRRPGTQGRTGHWANSNTDDDTKSFTEQSTRNITRNSISVSFINDGR